MNICKAAVLLTAVAAISCSEAPSTPTAPSVVVPTSPASVRVTGRIVDYATRRSIPGYPIRWSAGTGGNLLVPPTLNSVTDAAGRFSIEVPVDDDFTPLTDTLVFEVPNASGLIRIPGKSVDTDVVVNPGTCNIRYGHVYDAVTHLPIAGARVSRRSTTTTDANGFYLLEIICDAPPDQSFGIGTTTVGVTHPAYNSTFEFDGRGEWTGRPGIRRIDFALKPLP